MIAFPNAKINLGLHVIGKREDGFHDLETIFYPIPLYDVIEIIRSGPDSAIPVNSVPVIFNKTKVYFSVTGLSIGGDLMENICIHACRLLLGEFPDLPDFQLFLHKHIPAGAGLGGGSADAAFTLQLINETFNLELSDSRLESFALQLGSDVPFFIRNVPVFAERRGEQMENIKIDLLNYSMIVVYPGVHVSTKEAFGNIQPTPSSFSSLKHLKDVPISQWKDQLKNVFEDSIFENHPALAVVKDQLYQKGALYASMTGSGSALYGIFPQHAKPSFTFPAEYRIWHLPVI